MPLVPPIVINVGFTTTSSFVPNPQQARLNFLDKTNPLYVRNSTLTNDALYLQVYTASVAIPMSVLYSVATTVLPALTWPPILITNPTNSVVTHPQSASFSISASAETPINYQWYSQSFAQALTSSTYYPLTNSAGKITGATSNLLTFITSSVGISTSSFLCVASNVSGQATSSYAYLFVN
jgi:hypothetical protein